MLKVVYLVISLISFVPIKYAGCETYVGDFCTLQSTGASGQCQFLKQCQSAIEAIQSGVYPQTCGIQDLELVVCCSGSTPVVTQPPPITTTRRTNPTTKPTTRPTTAATKPEKQQGQCVPLHACLEALHAFANPPKGSETYLRQYLCRGEQGIYVRCDNSTDFSMLAKQHSIYDSIDASSSFHQLHLTYGCNERFEVQDGLPVLPVLLAKTLDSNKEHIKCVGVQVNEKYVITTAQCLAQDKKSQESAGVRMRFTTKSNKSYFYDIEEQIPHPYYDPTTGINDLALLRLNDTVVLDDNTFPCMEYPLGNGLTTYGGLDESRTEQWFKKNISVWEIPQEMCNRMLQDNNVNIVATSYATCTREHNFTEASCNKYAGVPLYGLFHKFRLEGISSSRIDCADDLPRVFTKLYDYFRWLVDNMRRWNYEKCTTPNGEAGRCKSIINCPALMEIFSNVRNDTTDYLRKFICREDDKDLVVCCPASTNSAVFENRNDLKTDAVPPKFIESELCGMQHSDDYFSSSTAVTKIDEFPWLASIYGLYRTCAGLLINKRYVITIASCNSEPKEHTSVRLGPYTAFQNKDCIKDLDVDGTDCTETKYFGVEDVIIHEFYIKRYKLNNVALIRLNETVFYTDYIRPICLPLPGTEIAKPGNEMYMSSWCIGDPGPFVKGKILFKMLPNKECRRIARETLDDVFIGVRSICAKKLINADVHNYTSCNTGGGLFSHHNYKWHIEGIFTEYQTEDMAPHVYLNISEYMHWILTNMYSWK